MPKPRTPTTVDMTVQVLSVCAVDSPKNRLTSQKPESFTWLTTEEPAAVEATSATSCTAL